MEIRYQTFPRTIAPQTFVCELVAIFDRHSRTIDTTRRPKGLRSDEVLSLLRPDLVSLGFDVEAGKRDAHKIRRPVFFGPNGKPELQYDIDAWHPKWRAGLEIEAGRAWMGNAVYRDLVQALVMVEVDYLFLAVPKSYKYKSDGKQTVSKDFDRTASVAQALYGHSRVKMPFSLCLIGY